MNKANILHLIAITLFIGTVIYGVISYNNDPNIFCIEPVGNHLSIEDRKLRCFSSTSLVGEYAKNITDNYNTTGYNFSYSGAEYTN